ncbi:hypothetical protein FRC20_008031, partial [Serendipita sp. 405]
TCSAPSKRRNVEERPNRRSFGDRRRTDRKPWGTRDGEESTFDETNPREMSAYGESSRASSRRYTNNPDRKWDNALSDVHGDDERAMRSTFRGTDSIKCYHCDGMGHRARDCPTKPPATCWNCGEPGHQAFSCPKPSTGRRGNQY